MNNLTALLWIPAFAGRTTSTYLIAEVLTANTFYGLHFGQYQFLEGGTKQP